MIKNCVNVKKYFAIICSFFVVLACCFSFGCGNSAEMVNTVSVETEPDYYDLYMTERIQKINEISENNTISKSFYFITDLHWEANAKKSPELINSIQSETNVKSIVFGGDYISNDYEDENDALTVMKECVDSFNTDDYVAIIGNHELNNVLINTNPKLDDTKCNNVINKGRFEKSYFNVIDENQKICSIYLNTNIFYANSEQYNWLKDLLIGLDESYTVLIFMHIYNEYRPAGVCLERGNVGKLLDNLLDENKAEIKCTIAGIFSGHTHRDYFDYNHYGCPVISTTCDSIGVYWYCDNLYTRERNSVSEQAFDVVQIDLSQKKVFLTRIGAGVDRIYYYK